MGDVCVRTRTVRFKYNANMAFCIGKVNTKKQFVRRLLAQICDPKFTIFEDKTRGRPHTTSLRQAKNARAREKGES
jgi:hypothetical protein